MTTLRSPRATTLPVAWKRALETIADVYLMKTEVGVVGTLLGLLAWFPLLDWVVRAGSLAGFFVVFLGGTVLAAALLASENQGD